MFETWRKPHAYLRYVRCSHVLQHNFLNPALQFTIEVEFNCILPFFDFFDDCRHGFCITRVFLKPPLTDLDSNGNSSVSKARKMNLISTLVHRALVICFSCTFDQEKEKIHPIFIDDVQLGIYVIMRRVERLIRRLKKTVVFGPSLCPVYLKVPWLGRKSQIIADRVSVYIESSFPLSSYGLFLRPIRCFHRLSLFQSSSDRYKYKS